MVTGLKGSFRSLMDLLIVMLEWRLSLELTIIHRELCTVIAVWCVGTCYYVLMLVFCYPEQYEMVHQTFVHESILNFLYLERHRNDQPKVEAEVIALEINLYSDQILENHPYGCK